MNKAVVSTALTGCLAPDEAPASTSCLEPIDKNGLEQLIAQGRANPAAIKTLKCKTVAEGRFRHLNFVRNLPAYVVDEPPGLLGDDTAPNPSEASLAALGSCLAVGIHANAVARGINVFTLEIELEGDLNITAVWGTGDVSEKPVGFTDVRAKVTFEADRPRTELEALVAHARLWSPVANTFSRPVNLEVSLA
ncbi:OsmC family protein [uncultured Methylovirgula sp.]|uniref:OsmC family protein n=1 Tax=uncultured Methylovirgula sp. TaxID=1285960 RepID=UPI002627AF0B|nr:OsmC family protein [uncultured Methylovirgula sp.]